MKKASLIVPASILVAGLLPLLSISHGQTASSAPAAAASGTASPAAPWPPNRGAMVPGYKPRPPQIALNQTILSLRRAKMELQHSKDELGGHRQSAIDACEKAIQELEAALRASDAKTGFSPGSAVQPVSKPSQQ
jgi:hypothetical protein